MSGVLLAGLGNIFRGDDGFGVEVARRLSLLDMPAGVLVKDFGVRSLDLAYALLEDLDAAVLIDAAQRGGIAGDLYLIEAETAAGAPEAEDLMISGHELDPAKVLRLVAALGGGCRRILVLACEPATFGDEDGLMGLSAPVAVAVDRAVDMARDIARLLACEGPLACKAPLGP